MVGLSCVLLLCPAVRAQDLSVSASVDRTTAGVNDRVAYTVRVEGAGRNDIRQPSAPAAEGLTLLRTQPDVDHRLSYSGAIRQSHSYRWYYRPAGPGRARIDAANVTISGRTYQTAPIEIDIVAGSAPPNAGGQSAPGSPPDASSSLAGEDLFIRATPSTRSPYVNEQVVLEYRLFFRYGVRIRNSVLADSWDADGFWREELKVDPSPVAEITTVDGQRYATILLKRVALFPTRTGRLQVEPLVIETEAFAPYSGGSALDRLFSLSRDVQVVRVASPPVTVEVKPLPPGAPASFQGAVGSFEMEASAPPPELHTGDPLERTVTLSGSGNFGTMQPPAFDLPEAFERYDPQTEVSIAREGSRVTGSKTFSFVAVPREAGTYDLPPVVFSYLDPRSGGYRTLSSQPATVTVTGRAATASAGTSPATVYPPDDMAGLMEAGAGWVRIDRNPLYALSWPYALVLLPLAGAGTAYAVRRARSRPGGRRMRGARGADDSARLSEIRSTVGTADPRAFYAGLEQVLLEHLSRRFGFPERGLSRRELEAALAEAGVPEATRSALGRLLDAFDHARFAPVQPSRNAMKADADRAEAVLTAVDRIGPRNAGAART